MSDGRGSNQWVVGPERSALGAPIALIDPHLAWEPQNRFYEARVHGGDLNFYGFSIIGRLPNRQLAVGDGSGQTSIDSRFCLS